MKKVFSMLVENTSGVLSHISGLFSRRGYNIDSFSAGVTADDRYTRLTVVASGDENILTQIENQLAKLEDVFHIKELKPNDSVQRELMLIKILTKDEDKQYIISLTKEVFHGKVVDMTKNSMVLEITGKSSKLESFLEMLDDYRILELARTGLTGLSRGVKDVYDIDPIKGPVPIELDEE